MKPQAEVDFFDAFAEQHGEYDVLGECAYRRLLSQFESLCRPRSGEKCLDCGCGTGAFTRRLVKFELELLGVDISPQSIQTARAKAGRESYVVGDITELPLPDRSVDILVLSGVLHHFPDEQSRAKVLSEAFRVLGPGGKVFGFDPSAHSPSMWLYRSPASPFHSKAGKTENEVLLAKGQLISELKNARFEKISVQGVGGITYKYVKGRIARSFLPLYNIYERLLEISPVENWLGTFLISFGVKPGL